MEDRVSIHPVKYIDNGTRQSFWGALYIDHKWDKLARIATNTQSVVKSIATFDPRPIRKKKHR